MGKQVTETESMQRVAELSLCSSSLVSCLLVYQASGLSPMRPRPEWKQSSEGLGVSAGAVVHTHELSTPHVLCDDTASLPLETTLIKTLQSWRRNGSGDQVMKAM